MQQYNLNAAWKPLPMPIQMNDLGTCPRDIEASTMLPAHCIDLEAHHRPDVLARALPQ